ncbi:DMT family transporter [Haloferula rosea]|uniref:DMT family transporter n=1 Tax=Haloferula rosea TaxID=490093 RepID=A0A934RII2_9BACT|nr:DMT family transporter [Haloferula rosea]MBK1828900.1 DMT family transporter [Haloferula rosea]
MPTLLQLHLLVALVATTALIGHVVTVSAPVLVCWRTALAAVGAFLWVRLIQRRKIWLGWKQVAPLLGVGAIVGCHWLAFFGAIKLANISICLAGMATISLFTAFTEPLITRRRVRPFEVLLGLLVVAGILLIANVERGHLLGLGVALVGAFLAAIFPVFNSILVNRGGAPQLMVGWEMVGACLAVLALLPAFDDAGYASLLQTTGTDWIWFLVIAWACTVLGHGWHIHLLRRISAYTGNLAMNFEPVYGMLAAAIVFGEYKQLHPAFYLGTLSILIANLLHPYLDRRFNQPRP